jgi:hypothetical protein
MKYQVNFPSAGQTAYVLGAREGSGNIGEAIVNFLGRNAWAVYADDGAVGDGSRPPGGNIPNAEVARQFGYTETDKGWYQRFEAPSVLDFEKADADALIITLGKTAKTHFAEIADYDISQMIRANLVRPLEAARRFVQATDNDVMESKGWTKEQADAYAAKDLKMPEQLKPEEVAEVVHTLLTIPAMGWLSGQGLNLYGGSR